MNKGNNSRELTKEGMANFLDGQPWNLWTTLSTEYGLSMKSARRSMERMTDKVAKDIGQHRVFWAAEPFDVKEGYHIHSLWSFDSINWSSDNKAMYKQFVSSWRTISNIDRANVFSERYDKGKGAHHYCAKYISKNLSDYDFFDTHSNTKEWHSKYPETTKRIRNQMEAREDLRIYSILHNKPIDQLKDEYKQQQRIDKQDERTTAKEMRDMFQRI